LAVKRQGTEKRPIFFRGLKLGHVALQTHRSMKNLYFDTVPNPLGALGEKYLFAKLRKFGCHFLTFTARFANGRRIGLKFILRHASEGVITIDLLKVAYVVVTGRCRGPYTGSPSARFAKWHFSL
jgi:hypothetical protein